jgi:hypothetical protein
LAKNKYDQSAINDLVHEKIKLHRKQLVCLEETRKTLQNLMDAFPSMVSIVSFSNLVFFFLLACYFERR